ncbi:hypothetical protein C1I63_04400 [Rathayibacter caricis DSM 15933]|uniref:Fibronectin type-III domain-containing protein n=1 Tax=Rathayibacter caricis DSM 15933 TaxID=1328867 RepID=A0A2T4URL4_9MICO|nr:fibronectin type III domain-containing protein [Rathayibacter caricis]PTL72155.1 hypothetical protein C1I63_04400 [Rathayibacter caricis DSM 15933]
MPRSSSASPALTRLLAVVLAALVLVGLTAGPAVAAPVAASTPTISGTAQVGAVLTANPGTWTTGTTLTYRWYASGVAVRGATGRTFVPTTSQLGATVTVEATGAKAGYTSVIRRSAATAAVKAGKPTGATAVAAVTDGAARSVTVSWQPPASSGGSAITGYLVGRSGSDASGAGPWSRLAPASARSQTFTNLVAGRTYTFTVQPRNAVGSGPTSSIVVTLAAKSLTTAAPVVSGTPRVGTTLTAQTGTWTTGTALTYRWYASGSAIAGATARTLLLRDAQAGTTVSVEVTGTKAGYTTAARTSASTSAVAATVPGAPARVDVVGDQDRLTATVTWSPPKTTGGAAVTSYRVSLDSYSLLFPKLAIVSSTTRSYTFTGLREEMEYYFHVEAVNPVGRSEKQSGYLYFWHDYQSPGAPVEVSARKDDAARTATLTWKPPLEDDSAETVGYRVARDGVDASGRGPWSAVVGSGTRSQTFTDLVPGATYTLSVASVSDEGIETTESRRITMGSGPS